MLTKLEELVLLTVLKLQNNAYGITIYKHIKNETGKELSVGSVYFPLERLARRGYLSTFKGEPTPKRGGMSKKYYQLTESGISLLKETKKINHAFWTGVSDLLESFEESKI
jgi:DNA-binding PadR family transcriptional regulator